VLVCVPDRHVQVARTIDHLSIPALRRSLKQYPIAFRYWLLPTAFVLVTDEQAGRTIPNAFLEKVKEEFLMKCVRNWAFMGP
jgi:hypothetical protein